MANSKYEYVRLFEKDDSLLPNTYIVIRIDGRGFHRYKVIIYKCINICYKLYHIKKKKHYTIYRFSQQHEFDKPNDRRAIELMNHCAIEVMKEIHDINIAYGQSDEYSFVISKSSNLYSRRARY